MKITLKDMLPGKSLSPWFLLKTYYLQHTPSIWAYHRSLFFKVADVEVPLARAMCITMQGPLVKREQVHGGILVLCVLKVTNPILIYTCE